MTAETAQASPQEKPKSLDEAIQVLLRQPEKRVILTLTDVSGSRTTPAVTQKAKEIVKVTRERQIMIVDAIVGIDGVKKALAQLIKPGTYFAASLREAKDWLVAHAK